MRYIELPELLRKRYRWGNRQELWKNEKLKKDFRDYFHNKCWYTEIKLTGADIDIDHFRPKGAVKQYKHYQYNSPIENFGYFWLKNVPGNYRGSCIYANRPRGSGGKWDFFPLQNGSPLLSETNHVQEKPLLLDPCNRDDVNLVAYTVNDIFCTSSDADSKERVRVSRELYNWDDTYIRKERAKVWEEVCKTIEEYEANDISEGACLRRLNDAVSPEAPFSACAISCVQSLAPDEIKQQLNLEL